MIDLVSLSSEELEAIVNVIPKTAVGQYLSKNPKEFAQIMPGFRPDKLSESQIRNLLLKEIGKCNRFIVSFVEKFIKDKTSSSNKWSLETQLIVAINDLYNFKTEKEILENELQKLKNEMQSTHGSGVSEEEIDEYVVMIKERDADILQLKTTAKTLQQEIKTKDEELQRLEKVNNAHEKRIEHFEDQCKKKDEKIRTLQEKNKQDVFDLTTELEHINDSLSQKEQLIEELRMQLENPNKINHIDEKHAKIYRPLKYSEFVEEISDIISDIGIRDNKESFVYHLLKKIFSGKAIVAARYECEVILKCVSGILTNGLYETLIYSPTVNISHIQSALESDSRIVYLDNFIGNYNETMLIPLLQGYCDKIIVISAAYDKMLQYVADEFLTYINYISFSKYKINQSYKFKPMQYDEEEFTSNESPNDKVCSVLFTIMSELGFPHMVCQEKTKDIVSHLDANGMLMYEILPFISFVRNINPFSVSGTLNLYSEGNKIHASKQLMEKWYGR